ncbi:MAG: diguanylate cyclase, partial [Gammaproteobacteria bacterium]|nr:diguanylate cyclase [Gammaproteobacteria bacterium]
MSLIRDLIVIADADSETRADMSAALHDQGFQVEAVDNGAMACAAFVEHGPEIVILNVALPVQDGVSACAEIRRLPGGTNVPVVLISTESDTDVIDTAYLAGATDFVAAPIDWRVFGHRLQYFLRVSRDYQTMGKTKEEYNLLLNAMPDTFVVLDADNEIVDFNPGKFDNPLPRPSNGETSITDLLPKNVAQSWQSARAYVSSRGEPTRIEFAMGPDSDHSCYYEARFVPYTERRTLVMITETTERKLAEKRIRRLAFFDSLTGLPNRQAFRLQLGGMIDEAWEVGGRVAVIYVDLDNFKRINDTLGHTIGDGVLNAIAERLSNSIRHRGEETP